MSRDQIVRVAILSGAILFVVVALDYLINVVIAPGHTPYTPLVTIAIALAVTPAAITYLLLQNAKVQKAQSALAEERVARQAADGANAAKTQFLANMSHELRTPLNAIIGYAEMVEEETRGAKLDVAAEDSQRIQRSAHHLLGLISEILDHARLETGKTELKPAPTALQAVFNEVAETARAAAAANGNSFEAQCDPDIGSAYLDVMRLRQCMLNLTSNAAKFTKNGRISIAMSASGNDGFAFVVTDSGIGMPDETVERLFQPFVQADSSVTREYGGTGLGLAITKQLVDAMGGSVGVASEPGKGSTFTLTMKRSNAGANVVTFAA
ncbi:sensor histidine kinase [Terricaulis silvestris]|uniref:histidine kinase n=1 Tax=Terricaulis silvestris TaxID=2686094 RepID=A0A6I6MK29_9CAUL|nr:ATP-binding protein [Terricaulis silvestris]QGZ95635.1 Signal transduction histidine-protein kinase BarA [Terricaulis silvestris]